MGIPTAAMKTLKYFKNNVGSCTLIILIIVHNLLLYIIVQFICYGTLEKNHKIRIQTQKYYMQWRHFSFQ